MEAWLVILRFNMFHIIRIGNHIAVHVVIHGPRLMHPIGQSPIRRRISIIRRSVNRSWMLVFVRRSAVQRRRLIFQRRRPVERRRAVRASTILGRREEVSSILRAAPDLRVTLHLLRLLQRLDGVDESVHCHALRWPVDEDSLHAPKLHHLLVHLLLAFEAAHGHQKL